MAYVMLNEEKKFIKILSRKDPIICLAQPGDHFRFMKNVGGGCWRWLMIKDLRLVTVADQTSVVVDFWGVISRQIANEKRIIRLISFIFMWILLIDFFIKLSDVIYDHLKKFFMVYISICLLKNDHVKMVYFGSLSNLSFT